MGFAVTAAQFLASRNFEPFNGAAAFTAYAVAIGFGISVFNLAAYDDLRPRETVDTYARSMTGATLGALAGPRVGLFVKERRPHQRETNRWTVTLAAVAAGIFSRLSVSPCTLTTMTSTQNQGNLPHLLHRHLRPASLRSGSVAAPE